MHGDRYGSIFILLDVEIQLCQHHLLKQEGKMKEKKDGGKKGRKKKERKSKENETEIARDDGREEKERE